MNRVRRVHIRPAVEPCNNAVQRIYERLRVRDQLVTRCGDFIRQVRSIVNGTGRTLRGGTADACHRRREEVGEDVRDVVDPLFDVIASCSDAIDRIDARLKEIAKGVPAVERLLTVSGVGPITSLAFYAVIVDPTRLLLRLVRTRHLRHHFGAPRHVPCEDPRVEHLVRPSRRHDGRQFVAPVPSLHTRFMPIRTRPSSSRSMVHPRRPPFGTKFVQFRRRPSCGRRLLCEVPLA